jgi:hypothetical protein
MTTETTAPTDTNPVSVDPDAEAAAIWAQLAEQERAAGDASPTAAPPGSEPERADGPPPADSVPGGGAEPPSMQRNGGGQPAGDDIWLLVPEAARAAYETTQQRLRTTEAQRDAIAGRLGSRIQQLERELAAVAKSKTAEPKAKDGPDVSEIDDADLRALVEDFPEVGRPIATKIQSLQTKLDEALTRLNQRDSQEAQRAQDEAISLQERALAQQHPDWEAVTARPEFSAWLRTQPRYVVEGIQRNADAIVDADEAADIIGRFKATLPATAGTGSAPSPTAPQQPPAAPLSAKRQQQLEAAAAPPTRGAPKVTTGVPDDPEAAWQYWAEQDRRKAAQSR